MEHLSLLNILALAFTLGMLHALDADHIMAISSLIGQRPGLLISLRFCSRWALGHGSALLLMGMLVLLLGLTIPPSLSDIFESLVGVLLSGLGAWVLWQITRHQLHLHFHQHAEQVPHAHWHKRQDVGHSHEHGALFIGVLHGLAGSAPLLALIPITQMKSPWMGLLYLLIFAVGVLATMLLFGGLLGTAITRLRQFSDRLLTALRTVIAFATIAVGINLILRFV